MRSRVSAIIAVSALVVAVACDAPLPEDPVGPDMSVVGGELAQASGGGEYLVTLPGLGEFPGEFSFTANNLPNGETTGQLRYVLELFGEHVEFHGEVTCLTVDEDEGRAWIGGDITKNLSVREAYADGEIFQPGKAIWFRVLDAGEGDESVDRTTFVGFEGGAGIITSQEYCDLAIWPDDNARTWPVTAGNIQVR